MDHDLRAHFHRPMVMMRHGWSMSLLQTLAAVIDQVIVRCEDAVRQPVVAHELPDVLDRVKFRALGRQRDDVMLAGTVSLPVVCHPA